MHYIYLFFLGGFIFDENIYDLLFYSSNNLKLAKAWFFARSDEMNVEKIRSFLGDFSVLTSPAKCSSRMGLSLGDTMKTIQITADQVEIISDVVLEFYQCERGCSDDRLPANQLCRAHNLLMEKRCT